MRISGITYVPRRKNHRKRNTFFLILFIIILLFGGLFAIATFTDLDLPFIEKINGLKKFLQ